MRVTLTVHFIIKHEKAESPVNRNSQQRCSLKNFALKNFIIFTIRHLCWSLFLMKLEAWLSDTGYPTLTHVVDGKADKNSFLRVKVYFV